MTENFTSSDLVSLLKESRLKKVNEFFETNFENNQDKNK